MSVSAISSAANLSAATSAGGTALLNGNRIPEPVAKKEPSETQAGTASALAPAQTGSDGTKPSSAAADGSNAAQPAGAKANSAEASSTNETEGANAKSESSTVTLSPEARAEVAKLKARDLEVRQHEAAHAAVAGSLVTYGPAYTYQKGPDGVNYAIGGEVGIDTSPGRTPEETIERARRAQAAALAPAEPSGADLAVAAQAQQMEAQARSELAQQKAAQLKQTYEQERNQNSGSLSVFA